jgi:hypothetical protein
MYAGEPFLVSPLEEIVDDIAEASWSYSKTAYFTPSC